MKVINVILSGGVGSRLWPLSRKSTPKQYLALFDGKSLFELTVRRNSNFCEETVIVGGKDNYQLSREVMDRVVGAKYSEIIEASPRNTAAAIAFAALSVNKNDILLVTPSDQLIQEGDTYSEAINKAIDLAKGGALVTFGLVPTKPETGFGYVEYKGNEVLSFREKPSRELAERFIASGDFLWNSGMFCFQAGVFLEELGRHEPEILRTSEEAFSALNDGFLPLDLSMKIPSLSVDYAVMEKSDRIKVVPSRFAWSDMGSFDALYEYTPADSEARQGSNLVFGSEKHVEFVGLEDVILVETRDAILVLNRSAAQDVKKVYERLEKTKPDLLS